MRSSILLLTDGQVALVVLLAVGLYAIWDALVRRVPRLRMERAVDPPCPPLAALDAAAHYLGPLGYQMRGADRDQRIFYHPGAILSWRAIAGSHTLRVTATGSGLLVDVVGVARLGASDRRAFAERFEAMLAAVSAAARAEAELARVRREEEHGLPAVVRVHEKTVERQVVVARCRYCGALTPVDGRRCEHCGATGFC